MINTSMIIIGISQNLRRFEVGFAFMLQEFKDFICNIYLLVFNQHAEAGFCCF